MTEIKAEAEVWRATDPNIAILEEDLKRAWAASLPLGVADGSASPISSLETLNQINVDAPEGSRFGIRTLKRLIKKLTSWYLHYVTAQVALLGHGIIKTFKTVDQRLAQLEDLSLPTSNNSTTRFPISAPSETVAQAIATEMSADKCAVLSANSGTIIAAIQACGRTVYGLHHSASQVLSAIEQGLDVRQDDVLSHLNSLTTASLQGIVLTDVVETMPLAAIQQTVLQSQRVLLPNGVLVVAVGDPAQRAGVERELLANLGLSPTAWQFLLNQVHFTTRSVQTDDPRINTLIVGIR
ncbi:MAG: hypothetical protein F4138_04075 [Acidimicrobiia bacterium]|nr:hypothetical protein [Acidimicrobiia bacterium]MYC58396.1 hypothetical protein [Acidimicrobiia bacterium]MYG94155.1 hypothetical protein [Acidimicrobiia bacterium]MYI30498.1 hypothetical protein [Acidimicrobiia bacterium]